MSTMRLERWIERVIRGARESIRRVFLYPEAGIVAASDGYAAHWGRIPEDVTGMLFRMPVDVARDGAAQPVGNHHGGEVRAHDGANLD